MDKALRASDISAVMIPPEALRTLPEFRPGPPSPETLADLRRRADAARHYSGAVDAWAGKVEWAAAQIEAEAAPESVLGLERMAITLLWMQRNAEKALGPVLARHIEFRATVAAAASASVAPDTRAAWLGFLDLSVIAFKRVLESAHTNTQRAFAALQAAAPELYPQGIDALDPDRLRDERAIHAYQAAVEHELGLPTERMAQAFGEEVFRVLGIRVPPEAQRPHRLYREALDRAHARVRETAPEFAGRVGFEFLRG